MKPSILVFSMLLMGLAFTDCLQAQSSQKETTKNVTFLSKQVDSLLAEWDSPEKPGASVAVVHDGAIVYKKGYGSANLEYGIPNTPSTIFHIASVSKQFTAFSVLLLQASGQLSLDDDIRKYIPEVPDFGKTITLRHLANHTSGLRDQWNLLAMAGWRLDDVITKEHVLQLVSKQRELNFDPGEEFVYCNTGFTLLAEVVSRVSGKTFAEFTRENIFEPLKMSNTVFYDDHQKIVKNRAYSYYMDGDEYKKSVLSYANVGATSLFTTVEDLSRWTMNFKSTKVGNAEIIQQLNTKATLNNGKNFGGALGQFVNQYKGLNQIQHGGADAGYRTYLGRFPDQDFAVIVFSNYARFNPRGIALKIADLYLADYYVKQEAKPDKPVKKVKYKKLKPKQLERFTGFYWNEKDRYSRKIYVKDDTLRYFRNEYSESPLMPIDNNEFQMLGVGVDLKIKFEVKDNGQIMAVTIGNGTPATLESYEPKPPSKDDWAAFTGTYYSPELETSYTIKIEDDKLLAKHFRTGDIEIKRAKDDFFSSNRWYFGNVEFVRNSNGMVQGMKVSSGRVRNLWFEKRSAAKP